MYLVVFLGVYITILCLIRAASPPPTEDDEQDWW